MTIIHEEARCTVEIDRAAELVEKLEDLVRHLERRDLHAGDVNRAHRVSNRLMKVTADFSALTLRAFSLEARRHELRNGRLRRRPHDEHDG
jgi:hypothetical protein